MCTRIFVVVAVLLRCAAAAGQSLPDRFLTLVQVQGVLPMFPVAHRSATSSPENMLSRWLPLVGVTAFVGVGVALRLVLHHRRYGTWGVVLFQGRLGGQLLRDSLAIMLPFVLFIQAFGVALRPERWEPSYWFQPRVWTGAGLVGAGILTMVLAQSELGVMWRIGIDPAAPPQLVTVGLYRVCRNPIFSAMLITLIGFFLLMPTLISFVTLVGGVAAIRGQVVAEERYLLQVHGEGYRRYLRDVGRFVPWLGRRCDE